MLHGGSIDLVSGNILWPRHAHFRDAAEWVSLRRAPLRLPSPPQTVSSPDGGSGLTPSQRPAGASPPTAAIGAAAPADAGNGAAADTNGGPEAGEDGSKLVPPSSVIAELVALLSHKDNKARVVSNGREMPSCATRS